MPVGIIINSLSIVVGGAIGTFGGGKLSSELKTNLNLVFGLCAMSMGISSVILVENLPAVIFSIIAGTLAGMLIHLEGKINGGAVRMQKLIGRFMKKPDGEMTEEEFTSMLVTAIVLFCASGTGIYGSIISGMSGDHSILIAKSILDLFTALIFACALGIVVSVIAVPQFLIFLSLFLLAGFIYPLTTPVMVNDFKACGGILLLATGFRMMKVKMFPVADMIPAMAIVMPVSRIWTAWILPLL